MMCSEGTWKGKNTWGIDVCSEGTWKRKNTCVWLCVARNLEKEWKGYAERACAYLSW